MRGKLFCKIMGVLMAASMITGSMFPMETVAQETRGGVQEKAAAQETLEAVQKETVAKPEIMEARLINSRDIELYWNQEVTGAGTGDDDNFSVTVDGVDNPIYFYSYTWEEEDYTYTEEGIVYYNKKTSIRLENPIDKIERMSETEKLKDCYDLPDIQVTVKGNVVKNADGVYADETKVAVDEYRPFYQKLRALECGVKIFGAETVSETAMDKAKEMLEVILSNQALAERMGSQECMLGIYGDGNIAYDIPEHRYTYDENYLYVEGFGGTQLASIRDANVLRQKTGDAATGYPDESILVHEFGHTVKNFGLTEQQQAEWTKIYQKSIGAGKWKNTYAGKDEDEYFATLSAMWFNVMDDTYDGETDGTRGPINTRTELKVYDRDAYDFLANIYPNDRYLPQPWENGTVPNNSQYACSVTFVYEEGETKKQETATLKTGESLNESEIPSPKKEGYDFAGWKLGDTLFDIASKITSDITLQAEWKKKSGSDGIKEPDKQEPDKREPEKKTFQVAFRYQNGNKEEIKTVAVKEGEKLLSSDIPKPSRNGYEFAGWINGEKRFDVSSAVTSDLTLKADWNRVVVKRPSISSVKARGKKVMVTVKKVSGAKGYKVVLAKDKKFKKPVKTKYTSSNKLTVKRVKKGVYFVKVWAYKFDSAGKKVFSKVSKIKKVTVR